MLLRRRRIFAVLAFLLLATPLLAGVIAPDAAKILEKEARESAPAPGAPYTIAALFDFPRRLDAYLNDHFGLREKMIRLHKDLTRPVFYDQRGLALTGKSGRLYAVLGDMVLQSAGRTVREKRLDDTVDTIVAMRDALQRRGVGFLVALPPNSSTIYQDDLPVWARNTGRKTEYDLLYERLKTLGVKAVDLRPALSLARRDGPTFLLHDLHWNVRGAVTGFNTVVEADGRPDWLIEPSSTIGPMAKRDGGDIARILGIDGQVSEMTESLILKAKGTAESYSEGEMPDHSLTTGDRGPTIMVIGDSFTTNYFPVFLSQHVGRAIWILHKFCGFDWSAIDRFRPDEVWWMPVERFLLCEPGRYPSGFSQDAGPSQLMTPRLQAGSND